MELSVYDYLSQNYENKLANKRPLTTEPTCANSIQSKPLNDSLNDSPNDSSTSKRPDRSSAGSSHKKLKTNSNPVHISSDRPIENLDSSANSSTFSLKENLHCRPDAAADLPQTSFRSSLEQLANHLTQFSQPDRLNSAAITMLNGGMMLPNNLINGSQTMNGDNASAFSPNNLTGNGNSSNNTISGLSPSSSYDSYEDARCEWAFLSSFKFIKLVPRLSIEIAYWVTCF